MKLNSEALALLEKWLEDESFVHWAKQSNVADMDQWEDYFAQHPQYRPIAAAGRQLIMGVSFQKIPQDDQRKKKALTRLMQSLETEGKTAAVSPGKKKIFHLRASWWAAASIALLIIATTWIYFQFIDNPEIHLATNFGQTLNTTLPDSTIIVLNANSSLHYKRKNPRKVWLKGEAFFEVKKKPQTHENFQVSTEDLTITVLGTTFNVNTRNEQTRVFLEEGQVNLQLEDPQQQTIEMVPGDLVSYSKKQNKVLENRQDNALENTSWKEGVLLFADTPLPQALSQISDIYGVQFEIIDPVLEEKILSGGTPIRDLEITLQTLQEVFAINITKKDGKYLIDQ